MSSDDTRRRPRYGEDLLSLAFEFGFDGTNAASRPSVDRSRQAALSALTLMAFGAARCSAPGEDPADSGADALADVAPSDATATPDHESSVDATPLDDGDAASGACPGLGLPQGVTGRQKTGQLLGEGNESFTQWDTIWGLGAKPGWTAFPNVNNTKHVLVLDNDKFVAIEFSVPASYAGAVCVGGQYCFSNLLVIDSYTSNKMSATFSISPTCGDFDAADFTADANCRKVVTPNGGFAWDAFPASQPQPNSCKLTPGETYYLNLVGHGDGTGGASCPNGATSCIEIKNGNGNVPPPPPN